MNVAGTRGDQTRNLLITSRISIPDVLITSRNEGPVSHNMVQLLTNSNLSRGLFNNKTRWPRWPCIAHLIIRQVWFNWPFGSWEKFNIGFQDGGQLGFPIRTILATYDLQITSIVPMKFESIALLVQEKKFKIDFQHGCKGNHLGFWIRMTLAIFYLQVTPTLPIKFQVNEPFNSGEEVENRFSRRQLWRPSCISNRNDFSYFWSTSYLDDSF